MPTGQNDTPDVVAVPIPAIPARKPHPGRTPEAVQHHAMRLLAQGKTQQQVADTFDVSVNTVKRWLKLHRNATLVSEGRAAIRASSIRRIRRLQPALLDRLEGAVAAGNPKDLDALSRAALNVEKIAASASGEATQLPVAQDISIRIASFMRPAAQNADSGTAIPAGDVVDAEVLGPADVRPAGGA